jgi:uncharacterized protein (DUF1800 family)
MGESISRTLENVADAVEQTDSNASRRSLLSLAGIAALAAGTGTEAKAQALTRGGSDTLLRRTSFAVTEASLARFRTLGHQAYLEEQLAADPELDSGNEIMIQQLYPRLRMPARQLRTFTDDWYSSFKLVEATIRRYAFSEHQLLQKMVEFWHDHFNVTLNKVPGWMLLPYDRAIRQHALGNFGNLLRAVCQSPAMLYFLDNTENYGSNGNVNFSRELMELHTISVTGGYTPADIRNVARCFSGWMLQWDENAPGSGEFYFASWAHDYNAKVVLGNQIPSGGGKEDGDQVINILLRNPNTARFIARKLVRFFIAYEPPGDMVDAVAAEFTRTNGDIKSMLRVLLTPANLKRAQPKFKRPQHLFIGSFRQMQGVMNGDQWTFVYDHLHGAGQPMWNWSFPDGYPDRVDFWAGLALQRWNWALMLPQSYVWGTSVDIPRLLRGANTPKTVHIRINEILFGGTMPKSDANLLLRYLNAAPLSEYRIKGAFAIALASASYQWY